MAEKLISDLISGTVVEAQRVYLLMDGMYSDFHVVAVFRTEEDAEVYAATHQRELECPEIHEWPISPVEPARTPVLTCWTVWMWEDGTVTNRIQSYTLDAVSSVSRQKTLGPPTYRVTFTVSKGTPVEQVDKIARDRLAKYRYEMLEQELLTLSQQLEKETE